MFGCIAVITLRDLLINTCRPKPNLPFKMCPAFWISTLKISHPVVLKAFEKLLKFLLHFPTLDIIVSHNNRVAYARLVKCGRLTNNKITASCSGKPDKVDLKANIFVIVDKSVITQPYFMHLPVWNMEK